MIYFFSFLLVITILCGKSDEWRGGVLLVTLDIALIFAILKVGNYI